MSNLLPKHRNDSQIVFRSLTNRMANHAHEDQTKKAEDLDDEEGGATGIDEAGKDKMETTARNHSNFNLAPCGLRADAPDFVPVIPATSTHPYQSSTASAKGKGKNKAKPPPKPSKVTIKSTAGDIATRIHEDIAHNLYECPICTSELGRRSGPQTKELPLKGILDSKMAMSLFLLVPGAVLDAIFPMKYIHPPTAAGVKKKSTLDPSLVCPHIHAVRHAHGLVRVVRIHAIRLVTQVLVLLVHPWDQLKIVSAVGIHLPNDAKIPTMSKDGAVVKYVVICSHVVNTHVLFRATKGCVVLARSRSRPVVIVVKCRPRCCVAPRRMTWKARQCAMMDPRSGQDASLAMKPAAARLIAVCISVKKTAIRKIRILPIVLDLQMS
ncbi:uncharacterized protein N7443_000918 [Penicillium atrosanguineum]|uniref:uncharacterized protein n=1 Tax=Penicillium atrosanguineum TaxID=1132637 RepID=UPI00239E0572|nr:uncharacterized protein N7443_000918 [Penicillium atrosanguineum]KAJ5314034.1 hypothetical protein N7443_000918 [Penicillium atrosanguineum]